MDFITFNLVLLIALLLAANIGALWFLVWLLLPYLHFGGPYVPSSKSRVDLMIKKADLKPSDRVVDLGSGDGRIVLAAAQRGVKEAVGYEIHGGLVKSSRVKAKAKGLSDNTRFEKKNFWKEDLSQFDVVFLFQIPFALPRMVKKLQQELPKGARVISNGYNLPNWEPENSDHDIHLYKVT